MSFSDPSMVPLQPANEGELIITFRPDGPPTFTGSGAGGDWSGDPGNYWPTTFWAPGADAVEKELGNQLVIGLVVALVLLFVLEN